MGFLFYVVSISFVIYLNKFYISYTILLLIYSYNSIKTWIQGGNTATPLGPSWHMIAAAEAGILTLVMTNPIWVVKTRLCLQYDSPGGVPDSKNYAGMSDALVKIYRTEGLRGFYRVSSI